MTQPEALTWLLNNRNPSALATNHFQTTESAVGAVKRLYAAGATRVEVLVMYDEPWRIEQQGGPYADALDVTFPKERVKEVLAVIKSMEPEVPDENRNIEDFYESLRREIEANLNREYTYHLWWD